MERTGRSQCQASSTASSSDEAPISVSLRGEVNHQQGDGGENQKQGCHGSELQVKASFETKQKTAAGKQCKKRLKKRFSKCEARSLNYVNEQSNVSEICSGSTTLPQESAHVRRSSEPAAAFIVPNTGSKEHVTDEDERDTEQQYARSSRFRQLANLTARAETALLDIGQELSHNLPAIDDIYTSQDINEEMYDCLESGIQSNSSYATPINRMESFLAPFLNKKIPPDPEDRFFCAQSEDDTKLIQILRYIKSCDGALDLLWNFIREHAELLTQQQASVSRDTVKPRYDDKQYHDWLEEALKGGETRELLCSAVGSTEYTRTGFTGSNTETEEMLDAYSNAKETNIEKDDKIQIADTSSDTVSGYPLTPGTDVNDEDQMIITGDVQGAAVSHLGAEENVGGSSLVKSVTGETHWERHEEEQEQQTGKEECPVWQILKTFECPFQWVPDIVINSIPNSTIRENMITYLTGKPMNIIQVSSFLSF
jgi:hypothetical protein